MTDQATPTSTKTLRGSCHCGALRFEVDADVSRGGSRCNCSVCTKLAAFNGIVKPEAFRALCDEAALGQYRFGSVSTRFFCKHCGTHCYGRGTLPEVGGEFVSFSYNTIDELELSELPVIYWDGRHDNWHAGPASKPFPSLKLATDASAA
jgi:hypothetical protein